MMALPQPTGDKRGAAGAHGGKNPCPEIKRLARPANGPDLAKGISLVSQKRSNSGGAKRRIDAAVRAGGNTGHARRPFAPEMLKSAGVSGGKFRVCAGTDKIRGRSQHCTIDTVRSVKIVNSAKSLTCHILTREHYNHCIWLRWGPRAVDCARAPACVRSSR